MKKKNDYLSPELEIILLELSDIVTTSGGSTNPDPDTGGNNGGGYEGPDDTDW